VRDTVRRRVHQSSCSNDVSRPRRRCPSPRVSHAEGWQAAAPVSDASQVEGELGRRPLGHQDGDAPVLLEQVTGGVLPRLVARRRPDRHVQSAGRYAGASGSGPAPTRLPRRAAPPGWRTPRGEWGRPPVVELLPCRRGEGHLELELPGDSCVDGRWVRRAGPSTRCASSGSATRTSRCAPDPTTSSRVSPRPSPPPSPRSSPPPSPRSSPSGIPPCSPSTGGTCSTTASLGSERPVASVVTRPVAGSKRRMAPLKVSQTATDPSDSSVTPSGCCSSAWSAALSRWPKSKSPAPTWVRSSKPVRPPEIERRADVSASATQTREPSADAARPDGWASHPSAATPSRRPSSVVPARTATVAASGSAGRCSSQSWWLPAMAMATRSPHHARSHGVERSCSSAGPPPEHRRSGAPVPATRIAPSEKRIDEVWWLTESATSRSYPRSVATPSGRSSSPCGSSKTSAEPHRARSVSRSLSRWTTRWCAVSETMTLPWDRATTLPGKARADFRGAGGRYGLSPTRSVPFPRCSPISSPISAASPGRWPSPDIDATTYPSGSITTRVGQARAV